MGEISINFSELDNVISTLNSIKAKCDNNTRSPEAVGGGKTVSNLEQIETVYDDLFEVLSELINKTIVAFRSTSATVTGADKKAAELF